MALNYKLENEYISNIIMDVITNLNGTKISSDLIQMNNDKSKTLTDITNLKYSKEEKWTGKYWFDGKKIYTKSYSGNLPNTSTQVSIDTIPNLQDLIGSFGTALSIYDWRINVNSPFADGYQWWVASYDKDIMVMAQKFQFNRPYKLTIFYTKTTD